MTIDEILKILKFRLGISTPIRDEYLTAIIRGLIDELERVHGIAPEINGAIPIDMAMFLVDYAEFRYSSKGEGGGMPEHLMFRLKNLFVSRRRKNEG